MIVAKKLQDYEVVIKDEINFSIDDKEKYVEEFSYLQVKGVINSNNTFEGESWEVTIAKNTDRLNFFMNEFFFRRITNGKEVGFTFEEFNMAFRRYVLEMVYSAYSFGTIKMFISYTKSFLEKTNFLDIGKSTDVISSKVYGNEIACYEKMIEALEFIGFDIPEEYSNMYEEIEEHKYESRTLPSFLSIFDFIEIMKSFKATATKEELSKFYPVVLWWSITFVIPLRPSEMLFTKYDCTYTLGDKYYLKIRRTNKKGSPNKYRLDNFDVDSYYTEEIVEINKTLYDEIDGYKMLLDTMCPDHNKEFLFSVDLYKLNRAKGLQVDRLNNHKLSSKDFKYLLDRFYIEIVQNKYGRTLISRYNEDLKLSEKEGYIETLVPYDSRHIAIINLILMGNEHYTVMKMAGHDSLRTTKGYYDHLEEYTKAYSINYAKYLSTKTTDKFLEVEDFNSFSQNRSLSNWRKISGGENTFTKVDGGYCTYHLKDFVPCNQVGGIHSRCKYFNEDKQETLTKEITTISNKISSDVLALKELVNNAENIFRFSEKYSVLTQSIRYNMNTHAFLLSKCKHGNMEVKNE